MEKKKRLVPYSMLSPGFEAIYTGETSKDFENPEEPKFLPYGQTIRFVDDQENVYEKWTTWTWLVESKDGKHWDDYEIDYINTMQEKLGHLDDNIRQIREHIGSLVPCDSGFPVTVDELLNAIGTGELKEPSFHNGCCCGARWWETKWAPANQIESMKIIQYVLTGYLNGLPKENFLMKYPHAEGFINRSYEWLGPVKELTKLQKLMLERLFMILEICSKSGKERSADEKSFFESDRGKQIDTEISEIAGLPEIYSDYPPEFFENLKTISDPVKISIYKLSCALAHGLHGISDCHHSTFRWLEKWIYGIGTSDLDMIIRKRGTERKRLGNLLFGYSLGLDKWLLGQPMQFLLLDLGHIDLGFDPKNEILRVYAYLGEEKSPVKEWLAASLWHNLTHNHPAGLVLRHKHLIESAEENGINVREWMDSVLGE